MQRFNHFEWPNHSPPILRSTIGETITIPGLNLSQPISTSQFLPPAHIGLMSSMQAPTSPTSPPPPHRNAASSPPSPQQQQQQSANPLELPFLEKLAAKLKMKPDFLAGCLKSEQHMGGLKVIDLKVIITELRLLLGKPLRISGNKSELISRIMAALNVRMERDTTETSTSSSNNNGSSSNSSSSNNGSSSNSSSSNSSSTNTGSSSNSKQSTTAPAAVAQANARPSSQQAADDQSTSPPAKRARTAAPERSYPASNVAIMPPNTSLYNDTVFQKLQNPYFRVMKQLSVLPFGPKSRIQNQITPLRHVFQFSLDAETLRVIQRNREQKWAVHIRFFSKNNDITAGQDIVPRVNGKIVDSSRNLKKIRAKHIKEPFITPYPLDITCVIQRNNVLEFSNPKYLPGVAIVQLIQELTTEEILPTIRRSSSEFKKPTSVGDVEETMVRVSLRCPLGYCRIEHPARGQRCEHLQCFDVRFYLQFCHQQRLWHCPVCNGPIPFHELIIDEYFNSILKSMDEETLKAEIHPDGTFSKPDKSEKKQRSKKKEVGVPEIDLDLETTKQQQPQQQGTYIFQTRQHDLFLVSDAGSGPEKSQQEMILRPIRMERNSDNESEDEGDENSSKNTGSPDLSEPSSSEGHTAGEAASGQGEPDMIVID